MRNTRQKRQIRRRQRRQCTQKQQANGGSEINMCTSIERSAGKCSGDAVLHVRSAHAHLNTNDWSENNVANSVVTALNYKIDSCVCSSWLNFHIQHCVHVRYIRSIYYLRRSFFTKRKKATKNPSLSVARSTTIDYLSHLCDSANPISNVWHAFNV